MTGALVGAAVVALLQYLRSRDRRLLVLVAMFLLQGFSLTREWWDVWKDVTQGAVVLAGVALVLLLGPRPAAEDRPDPTPPSPRDGSSAD